ILSGIAWDHINVFPTFDLYVEQFRIFADLIEPKGCLIYCANDRNLEAVAKEAGQAKELQKIPYSVPAHTIRNGTTLLLTTEGEVPLL
ncbi:hypothetical protein NK983_30555, partial [Salmonella enterica subsp. enterica serovar Typhimurium]|nr:hypothetical protein [Salmonella enterica subsp. enterica serovar Typhimurium]